MRKWGKMAPSLGVFSAFSKGGMTRHVRDSVGLTGTNVGCDTSSCGACSVHMDGEAVESCTVVAVQADASTITTIEGLATNGAMHPMQKAFIENHALQCGFCTPGMVMAATSFLHENPLPSEREVGIGLEGNLCRCTGYHNIVKAVLACAGAMKGAKSSPPSAITSAPARPTKRSASSASTVTTRR